MVKSFCKDCPNRHTICHDNCEKYQEVQAGVGSRECLQLGHDREKGRKRYMGANGGADR